MGANIPGKPGIRGDSARSSPFRVVLLGLRRRLHGEQCARGENRPVRGARPIAEWRQSLDLWTPDAIGPARPLPREGGSVPRGGARPVRSRVRGPVPEHYDAGRPDRVLRRYGGSARRRRLAGVHDPGAGARKRGDDLGGLHRHRARPGLVRRCELRNRRRAAAGARADARRRSSGQRDRLRAALRLREALLCGRRGPSRGLGRVRGGRCPHRRVRDGPDRPRVAAPGVLCAGCARSAGLFDGRPAL
jgi:hypothetical protein